MDQQKKRLKSRQALGIVLLASALAGCTAVPSVERNEQGDRLPQDGLVNQRISSWSAPEPADAIIDDTHLRINISYGEPTPCDGFNVIVDETSEVIAVTLLYGKIPDKANDCVSERGIIDMAATLDTITVETRDPIGDREIIDGGELIRDVLHPEENNV